MPMISTCPRCLKQVSIPAAVDSTALVRCPLCAGEYALSEALALAPPELIPVGLPAAEESTPAAPETAAEPASEEEVQTEHEPESEGENEAAAVVKQFPEVTATARRRRRKPKSALQTLIEVVTGGLAGCLVAYYGLAFYYGPEFHNKGLPQLPLPGISWITAPRADDGATTKPAVTKPTEKTEKKPNKGKAGAANHRRAQVVLFASSHSSLIVTLASSTAGPFPPEGGERIGFAQVVGRQLQVPSASPADSPAALASTTPSRRLFGRRAVSTRCWPIRFLVARMIRCSEMSNSASSFKSLLACWKLLA